MAYQMLKLNIEEADFCCLMCGEEYHDYGAAWSPATSKRSHCATAMKACRQTRLHLVRQVHG